MRFVHNNEICLVESIGPCGAFVVGVGAGLALEIAVAYMRIGAGSR